MTKITRKFAAAFVALCIAVPLSGCDVDRFLAVAGWIVNPHIPGATGRPGGPTPENCADLKAASEAPSVPGQKDPTDDEEALMLEAWCLCFPDDSRCDEDSSISVSDLQAIVEAYGYKADSDEVEYGLASGSDEEIRSEKESF